MSNSEDCFKYQFHGSNSTDLNNIFTNNSNTINPLLPFGVHIKGGVSICTTKCGHTLNNCENIKIENIINYGKILVMVPNKKDSELILHYDSRNENADQEGNGKYKLKYICFTCPSTIKIGDIDSDLQSYLVYTNNNGLFCVISTLYRNASPIDTLADSLLNTLLNNNLPNKPIYHSLSSIISGSSVWLFLIPFDYIRTNIQSNIKHKTLFSNIGKNPKILWNGVSYMMIKSLPVNLINMVIYEYLKEICS